ncbi:MAG: hypothetical protein RDV48_06695 [Candidatus Eremiobacteraeota bacterium]|nr:hypothetical protein [Candidatus Eremiobacteraeota bacterium]
MNSIVSDGDKNPVSHEIWVVELVSLQVKRIALLSGERDSVKILGWSNDENFIYTVRDHEGRPELYRFPAADTRGAMKYNLELPCLKKLFYDRGSFFTFQDNSERGCKVIGSIHEDDMAYHEIKIFRTKASESLDLVNARVSASGDYFALGIYYSCGEPPVGSTVLWLYNTRKGVLKKTGIESYGRDMSIGWAPRQDLIALRVVEPTDVDEFSYQLCFYSLGKEERLDKLSNSEIRKSFTVFWNSQNRLFLVMNDSIYLMLLNNEGPVAKSLLNWRSSGLSPFEFALSPDGSRVVFNSRKANAEIKDDVFLMNIDGTNVKRVIEPEGRRAVERNPLYRFGSLCARVVSDLFTLVTHAIKKG